MKKTITLLFLVLSTSIASAQDTLTAAQMREDFNYMMEWKGYLDICKQSRPDMTPCKMIELYTRTDFPVRWVYPCAPCGNELHGGRFAVRRHGDIQKDGFPRARFRD